MDWKAQLDRAAAAVKDVAESDTVKNLTARAKDAAIDLAWAARKGAADVAGKVAQAVADPATIRLHYLNTEIDVVSPSDGLQVTRCNAGAVVIADQAGNGLVVTLTPRPTVTESVGVVKQLNETTWDVGPEDGVNVVVLKA
jgi:hypothetical protein